MNLMTSPKTTCWTTCNNRVYVVEVSTLNANSDVHRRDVCPHCSHRFSTKDMTCVSKDEERSILSWSFDCPHCKSELIVFND